MVKVKVMEGNPIGMKFAILAAEALVPYLSAMIENAWQLEGVELEIYDYGRLSNLAVLYPKLRDKYDGFLVSGLAVQTAIRCYFPEDQKPMAVFDTELEEIYHALLKLLDRDRGLDLSKVVVDIYMQINESHNCRALLDIADMEGARQRTMDFWSDISVEEIEGMGDRLFSKIKKGWESGEIVYVISRNSVLAPKLEAEGIPYTFLYPAERQVLGSARLLAGRIMAEKSADYMAVVVAVTKESAKKMTEISEEDDLSLQQAVLAYRREFSADFQMQKTTNGVFLFTNMKMAERMTGDFKYCTLSSYLKKNLQFRTCVAYGAALELSKAKTEAIEALQESIYRKATYAMIEDSLIGPLLPEAEPVKQVPMDEHLMRVAKNASLAPGTIRKIKTILGLRESNEITATELSERLDVKIRHTNEILAKLTTAGYAVQSGVKSTGGKGRPTRIYRIDI